MLLCPLIPDDTPVPVILVPPEVWTWVQPACRLPLATGNPWRRGEASEHRLDREGADSWGKSADTGQKQDADPW